MAEVLAILGGGAATAQLFHYSLVLLFNTSNLSRQVRHAPDKIQSWIDQSSTMRSMLKNICDDNTHLDLSSSRLLQHSQGIVVAVRSLLRPFRVRSRTQRPSKWQEILFVMRKEEEIEHMIESFKHTFNTMALSIIMLTIRSSHSSNLDHYESPRTSLRICDTDDALVISERSMMGVRLFCEGRLDEAEHLHRYAYTARRRLLGDKHPETISSKANIAMTMNEKGQHREAETMYREALLFFESALGRSHPNTLKTYTNLATSLHDQGKYEQASEAVITALPALKLTYGTGHEEFLVALEFHAILLHCLQMHAAALRVAKQVYKQRLRSSGYEHDDTQRVLSHVRDLAEDFEEEQVVNAFPLLIEAITN